MPFGGAGHLGDQIWHTPWSQALSYPAELRTLSVAYPLYGLALTNTADYQSEMCPLKVTDFCLFLYHWLYTILHGLLIPQMAFTSCHYGFEPATPRWESQHSNHTATPCSLNFKLAACRFRKHYVRTRYILNIALQPIYSSYRTIASLATLTRVGFFTDNVQIRNSYF